MNDTGLMFSLLCSEIFGSDEIIEDLNRESLSELYKLSKHHDMAHIVANALVKRGLLASDEAAKFQKQQMLAIYRHGRMDYELSEIYRVLEESKIAYMPLKGAVIRQYYPEPWMRTSCDIDILVHEEDLDRAVSSLTEALGYKAEEDRDYHDISLFSESGVHLELHFSIKEKMDNIDALLSKVWEYCDLADGTNCRYLQTNEYFMFHHIAHMSYHFTSGGCGIKPFVDLYLLMNKAEYNDDTVRRYCSECGLEKFYDSVKYLANVWFGGAEHTELSIKMQDFLLRGGVYGTKENVITLSQGKKGGKFAYIMHRIFMPYRLLKDKYPVLEKHKWLTPFMQVRRWFGVIFGGRIKGSVAEIKTSGKIDNEKAQEVSGFFDELGL